MERLAFDGAFRAGALEVLSYVRVKGLNVVASTYAEGQADEFGVASPAASFAATKPVAVIPLGRPVL